MKVCNSFLLGADPEFVIKSPRGIVNLAEFLDHGARNKLGYDHGGVVGECRPSPSVSAYEVVKDLRKILLKTFPDYYSALHSAGKWEAGAYKFFHDGPRAEVSLGGHLHYGLELRNRAADFGQGWMIRESRGVQCLDKLTTGLEYLDILPSQECQARRRIGYGRPSDVRFNGEAHFEYRSMCSWLFDPEIALLMLTLGKLAMRFPMSLYKRLPATPSEFSESLLAEIINRGAQKHSDDDCKILWEGMFSENRKLQRDPTVDFRKAWENMNLVKEPA